jgi:hypothetical protein
LLAVVFTLYLTEPISLQRQNLACLLFARRNGVKTTLMRAACFTSRFLRLTRCFSWPYIPSPLRINSSSRWETLKVARILWVAMLFTFIVGAISFSAFVKQTGWRAMMALIVLLTTQYLVCGANRAHTFSNIDSCKPLDRGNSGSDAPPSIYGSPAITPSASTGPST